MSTEVELSAEVVSKLVTECLFRDDEIDEKGQPRCGNYIPVTGLRKRVGFHPGRIKENEGTILALLKQLPNEFMETGGGGYTFLNMPMDKNGNMWGGQVQAEELILLGLAIDKVEFPIPRDMWSALPGGVPYVTVKA